MNDLAASIPAGSDGFVLLPYLAGERSRYGMHRPWACSMAWTIAPPHAHMIRPAMEGAALALRHNLHVAQQVGRR